jgi:hypothetical protein
MRNCQICNSNGKRVILNKYHDFEGMCLFECTKCGHRYIDGLHLSQAWFDDYYLTKYQTDDKPYSDARLASLADCIASYDPGTLLDIGGMDGELRDRVTNIMGADLLYFVEGVEHKDIKDNYTPHVVLDAVVLSHTLEHIYDVGAMFERIEYNLKTNGYLFIEVPIHLGYNEPRAYDWHWQHINKFRAGDLERLCTQKGYEIVISKQIEDYREYNVWRVVGRKNGTA